MEDEWEREPESEESLNLLFVTYRTGGVTIEEMLETIQNLGFAATVRE